MEEFAQLAASGRRLVFHRNHYVAISSADVKSMLEKVPALPQTRCAVQHLLLLVDPGMLAGSWLQKCESFMQDERLTQRRQIFESCIWSTCSQRMQGKPYLW